MDATFSTRYRREIRVFISSTFRDMQSERDHLINRVFPAVSREAAKRNVTIVPVDLRWGITEEEASQGSVVDICLEQIDRSRPFFIGLIGHRYGWCPTHDDVSSAVDRCPRLGMYVDHGMSMTEIEMQYGVLESESDTDALFLVKEDTPADTPDPGIVRLRDKLRTQRPADTVTYSGIEQLGECVRQRLMAMLDKYYPASEQTPEANATGMLWGWAAKEAAAYVDYSGLLSRPLAEKGSGYLYMSAEGEGRSALSAARAVAMRQRDDMVVVYYSAATGLFHESKKLFFAILKHQLITAIGIDEDPLIPHEPFDEVVGRALSVIKEAGREVLVIIDGADKMEYISIIEWTREFMLPFIGGGCHIEMTLRNSSKYMLRDALLQPFRDIELQRIDIPAMDRDARRRYVAMYLDRFGKNITDGLAARLVSVPMTLRELRFVLDEMVVYGTFETLPDYIGRLLALKTKEDRYMHVLHRVTGQIPLEEIAPLLSVLAVTVYGIPEYELWHDILHWTPLRWAEVQGMMGSLLLYTPSGICPRDSELERLLKSITTDRDREDASLAIALALEGKRMYDAECLQHLIGLGFYDEMWQLVANDGATLGLLDDGNEFLAHLVWSILLSENPVKYPFTPLADCIEDVSQAIRLLEFNQRYFRNIAFVDKIYRRFYGALIDTNSEAVWHSFLSIWPADERISWLERMSHGYTLSAYNMLVAHYIEAGDIPMATDYLRRAANAWSRIRMSKRYSAVYRADAVRMYAAQAYVHMLSGDIASAHDAMDQADSLTSRTDGDPHTYAYNVAARCVIDFIWAYRSNVESPDYDMAYAAISRLMELTGYTRMTDTKNGYAFEIERVLCLLCLVYSDDVRNVVDMWLDTLNYFGLPVRWRDRLLIGYSLPYWIMYIPGIDNASMASKIVDFYLDKLADLTDYSRYEEPIAAYYWNSKVAANMKVDREDTPRGLEVMGYWRKSVERIVVEEQVDPVAIGCLWPDNLMVYSDDAFASMLYDAGNISGSTFEGAWQRLVLQMEKYGTHVPAEIGEWFDAVGLDGMINGMYRFILRLYLGQRRSFPLLMQRADITDLDSLLDVAEVPECPVVLQDALIAIVECLHEIEGMKLRIERMMLESLYN